MNEKPIWKRWWVWAAVVVVVIVAAAMSSGNDEKSTDKSYDEVITDSTPVINDESDPADATVDEAVNTEETKPSGDAIGDGIYLVGEDVNPGIYKSDGNVSYWARLKDTSGDTDSILANDTPNGIVYVEIKKTDKAFETSGGFWTKIDLNKYEGEKQDEYTDGMYIVGKDIDPGTYKYEITSDNSYWARLRNVSGDINAIIANDTPDGPGYLTISKSDFAVEINGLKLTKK